MVLPDRDPSAREARSFAKWFDFWNSSKGRFGHLNDDELVQHLSRTQPHSEDRYMTEAELRRRERRSGERIQAAILVVLLLTLIVTSAGLLISR